jgi:transcriptional regulator with XRE-family HTH domain
MKAAERLRALRLRTGMTRQAFARHIGYRSASGYFRYEDPAQFDRDQLPPALVDRLASIIGIGVPPITPDDITELRGVAPESAANDGGVGEVRAAYARLGNALAAGKLDEAAGHCHLLLGSITLLAARQRR